MSGFPNVHKVTNMASEFLNGPFLWKVLLLPFLPWHQLISSSSLPSLRSPSTSMSTLPPPDSNPSSTMSINIIGDPVSVWSAAETMNHCDNGQIDVPDIPARAFLANNDSIVRINVGAVGYHEMHGPTLLNQTRSCDIAWNATFDPDPSMFAGNEFLDSTVRFENGTVVALVHTEFPGEMYNACDTFQNHIHEIRTKDANHDLKKQQMQREFGLRSGQHPLMYPTCWTVSIGLAVSHDFGITWSHVAKPPHHLVAAVPYTYNQSHMAYGWGDPSNIVRHCSDEGKNEDGTNQNGTGDCYYYVAMYNRNRIEEQPSGICMARTKDVLDPTSWRGWNGNDFSVEFANPYTQLENFDPLEHVCETIDVPGIPEGCTILGLVWSKFLHEFVASIGCLVGNAFGKAFYVAISKDLIHWSPIQQFYNIDQDLPPNVRSQTTSIQYPSLLDPSYGGPNFDTIGQDPYLFWTSIGHSPHTDGRHLWATPIQFDIDAQNMDSS